MPSDLDLPAAEIPRRIKPNEAVSLMSELAGRTLVWSSDAHTLEDIGWVRTPFGLEEPTYAELTMACRGLEDHRVRGEDTCGSEEADREPRRNNDSHL